MEFSEQSKADDMRNEIEANLISSFVQVSRQVGCFPSVIPAWNCWYRDMEILSQTKNIQSLMPASERRRVSFNPKSCLADLKNDSMSQRRLCLRVSVLAVPGCVSRT